MLATRKFFCLLPLEPTDNEQMDRQTDSEKAGERASFMGGQERTTTNGLVNFLIYFPAALHGGSV